MITIVRRTAPLVAFQALAEADGFRFVGFTESLRSVKDSLFGGQSQTDQLQSSASHKASEVAEDVEGSAKKGSSGLLGSGSATLAKVTGIFTTLEKNSTGMRYAERPEGIDQFGGEEIERESYVAETTPSGGGVAAAFRKFQEQPIGLDQFGGETLEREVVEVKEWETKPSHTVQAQKWPQGVDQVAGLSRNDGDNA